MAPHSIHLHKSPPVSKQQRPFGKSVPSIFIVLVLWLLWSFSWPRKWVVSGTAVLTYLLLLGASKGHRILPIIPLWTILSTLNLAYAIAATSWLLNGVFSGLCYVAIFVTCVIQFSMIADLVRHNLRVFIRHLQFINDSVAIFDIPALEIDTEVDGLMVIRGLTFSLSTLTLVAHGVEVGIKLSDDMELAIQVEEVTVAFFRSIKIGDVYANIKGGAHEMTFGNLDARTHDLDGEALMRADTAILKRAATTGDTSRPKMVKMTSRMTDGASMEHMSAKEGLGSMTTMVPDNESAMKHYQGMLRWIHKTNMINQCRHDISKIRRERPNSREASLEEDMRAAISTRLHSKPSIPHPPPTSIRVSTLKNLSGPETKKFMHRLPMLLRLLLFILSYFHPIHISAIVAAGSGKWITAMLQQYVFQGYTSDNSELRRLEQRILSWLSDANFVFQLEDITASAQVPFMTAFDISVYFNSDEIVAYRTVAGEDAQLNPVVRLNAADGTFAIPSCLLPHHEHLLPSPPKKLKRRTTASSSWSSKSNPIEEPTEQPKDETSIKMSVHAQLPAAFDQELLNFVAALVKATKVVELEKDSQSMDVDIAGFRDFAKSLNKNMKDGMKKAMVDGIVNDRWIAKMVGKITRKMETLQGAVGYTGKIPVPLEPYRLPPGSPEAVKILG